MGRDVPPGDDVRPIVQPYMKTLHRIAEHYSNVGSPYGTVLVRNQDLHHLALAARALAEIGWFVDEVTTAHGASDVRAMVDDLEHAWNVMREELPL